LDLANVFAAPLPLLLLFLLAHQGLMPPRGFAHLVPFTRKRRFLQTELARGKLFDLWGVNAHAVLDLSDVLKAIVESLQGSLLALQLKLPFRAGTGQGEQAGLL